MPEPKKRPAGASKAGANAKPGRAAAARQQAAAMREQEQRRQARKQGLFVGAGAVAIVAIVAVVLVIIKVTGKSDDASKPPTGSDLTAVVKDLTNVPASALDTVGAGNALQAPRAIQAPALTSGGKPQVLYIGAEYCPYCAAERWPLIVALSRFGTFTGLEATTSAGSPEVNPNTPTFSFVKAKYSSDYLTFTAREIQDREHKELQKLNADENKIINTYDVGKYTGQQGADGSIPFMDFGGKRVMAGASVDGALFKDKHWADIAKATKDPKNKIGAGINGSANVLTASICQLTDNKPADVCTAAGVKAAAGKLP